MRRIFSFPPSLKSGFTLFELLVSISIIGLLIALATVSFSSAQSSARDARRRGDLGSLRNAFEQYYAANSSSYPASCNNLATTLEDYLPNGLPDDPQPSLDYEFTCSATTYCVCADLEGATGGTHADDACASAGEDFYCVQALQ